MNAVVIGSGPNGLAAAIELQRQGVQVQVLEAAEQLGGGMRSEQLTLPGFVHDVCSACHPLGVLSPFFKSLPLTDYGLRWLHPGASVAHPLDNEPAVILEHSLDATAVNLGIDAEAWRGLLDPFLKNPEALLEEFLGPLMHVPSHPLLMARFGLKAIRSAVSLADRTFVGERARALLAGCSAHSVLPLEQASSAGIGLMFAITAHMCNWPVAAGGSANLARALAAYFQDLGGEITLGTPVTNFKDLPPAAAYVFDCNPKQLAQIAEDELPARYVRSLQAYRHGPACFKVDWALSGPIPWADQRCLRASTVHVGGTLAEIAASERAAWQGLRSDRPFLILCQQSQIDPSRCPKNKHTGYAYCHVPANFSEDMTEAIESQVERFAPGFRERILARHVMTPKDFATHNPNFVGGDIIGGVSDLRQVIARPTLRWDPYSTPNPQIFICSASTPPGGGVHGMCGYHAAQSVLRRLG